MSSPATLPRARFFTICASNYLAHALVLARSLAATQRGARLIVFLLDAMPADCEGRDEIDVISVASSMPEADWHHLQCYYTLLELATGVKPHCFLEVLSTGCDAAIYLDADVVAYAPFTDVLAALAAHDLVVTPHILTPLPADGKLPDDLAIMRAGIYNLGFAAFANTAAARAYLAWWRGRLRTQGTADVAAGLFTDQKWMDFATAFCARTCVLRAPGCNVAYWNLHERIPGHDADGWHVDFVDGTRHPLAFYHFSGYVPARRTLSRHETRFGLRPPGATSLLLADYAARLEAAGYAAHVERTVAPPRFASGPAWDSACRVLYRSVVAMHDDYGDPLADGRFLAYASAPAFGDHVSRYARAILAQREDLVAAYDDGRNRLGLARWLATDGVAQMGVDPALLPYVGLADDDGGDAGAARDAPAAAPGVAYVGYFRSHLGIGEAARNAVVAMRAAGIVVTTHDISHLADAPVGDYDIHDAAPGGAQHAITVLGVNADETPRVLATLPRAVQRTTLVGSWAWETGEFPDAWCDRFALVDEVWVASTFVADALRAKATVPVVVVPYAINVPEGVAADRDWLAGVCPDVRDDEFVFVSFFDVASVPFRKNPHGAVDAFVRAFAPDEPVRLVVKVLNGQRAPDVITALVSRAAGHRVSILDAALDHADRFRLLATADAVVSLHRSEGFGLVIAEAMALARPVVVTAWSGNMDFTTADNAALVAFDLVRGTQAHGPYAAGTEWAEPDMADAAKQMRRVWRDAEWRTAIARAGAATIRERLAPAVVGAHVHARLERLRQTSSRRAQAYVTAAHPGSPLDPLGALRTVLRDVLRRPGHYAQRLHRVPALVAREGMRGLVQRTAQQAKNHDDSAHRANTPHRQDDRARMSSTAPPTARPRKAPPQ
ncbi:MAG: glycosyltransferase family 4 protein [Proteobacteria bacterium]|nr:glycosyltransferase family 4 protein [Pseudomonadota bacterium]